jgi:hypothetical protein
MMKYTKPAFDIEEIETIDIVNASQQTPPPTTGENDTEETPTDPGIWGSYEPTSVSNTFGLR